MAELHFRRAQVGATGAVVDGELREADGVGQLGHVENGAVEGEVYVGVVLPYDVLLRAVKAHRAFEGQSFERHHHGVYIGLGLPHLDVEGGGYLLFHGVVDAGPYVGFLQRGVYLLAVFHLQLAAVDVGVGHLARMLCGWHAQLDAEVGRCGVYGVERKVEGLDLYVGVGLDLLVGLRVDVAHAENGGDVNIGLAVGLQLEAVGDHGHGVLQRESGFDGGVHPHVAQQVVHPALDAHIGAAGMGFQAVYLHVADAAFAEVEVGGEVAVDAADVVRQAFGHVEAAVGEFHLSVDERHGAVGDGAFGCGGELHLAVQLFHVLPEAYILCRGSSAFFSCTSPCRPRA